MTSKITVGCNVKKSLTHHQACSDCDQQLKPEWKFGDYFGDEGGDGVPIVWFMKFCLIKTVN